MMDDLNPSGADKRPAMEAGTTGPAVGQNAPDFTLSDTLGNSVTLSGLAQTVPATVLYFTMWCPVCESHMSHMRDNAIPRFPSVRFLAVDYVSGSVTDAREAELNSGYAGSSFTVLVDADQAVKQAYQATMGTTVVVDSTGVILLNEDYHDGGRLQAVLSGLQ
jgi:peroxiredoxin